LVCLFPQPLLPGGAFSLRLSCRSPRSSEPQPVCPTLGARFIYSSYRVSECGGFTAAVPGLANIQPVKPATKKKNMSAIVATAKLRSARRDRSHTFVDGLAFILIGPMMARAPSPTCPPIFPAPASSTRWVNPIWRADRDADRMSKSFRIWFSIFVVALPRVCLPFRCHWQIGWAASTASRCTEKTRSKSFDLITHLPSRLSTMNWISTAISGARRRAR
jgi:hypothetical protein